MSRSRDLGSAASSLAAPSSANNGYSHVVDTTQASGWNYSPLNSAGRNILINGGFDFWQRLAAPDTPAQYNASNYSADRWAPMQYQSCRASRATNSYSTPGPISQYVMQVSSISSANQANGARLQIQQKVESVNTYPLRGKQVTLSFWIKFNNATFTSTNNSAGGGDSSYGTFSALIASFTSTTDGTTSTTGADANLTILNIANGSLPIVWTKYSITGTVPTNANNINALFSFASLGSTATNDVYNYQIADVQLEQGSVATPFTRAGGSIGGELSLCQRYFEKSYDINVAPGTITQIGAKYSSGSVGGLTTSYINDSFQYKVTKRAIPSTVIIYDLSGNANKVNREYYGVSSTANQNATLSYTGTNGISLYSNGTASAGSISYQYTVDSEL